MRNLGSGPFSSPYGSIVNCWDVSRVTNMSYVFNTEPLQDPVSTRDWIAGMFPMSSTWNTCSNGHIIFNQPLNAWNVSNVQTMAGMFRSC